MVTGNREMSLEHHLVYHLEHQEILSLLATFHRPRGCYAGFWEKQDITVFTKHRISGCYKHVPGQQWEDCFIGVAPQSSGSDLCLAQ